MAGVTEMETGLDLTLDAKSGVHLLAPQAAYAPAVLIWRPNGWMRGNDFGSAANDGPDNNSWSVRVKNSRAPTGMQSEIAVTVLANGLICIGGTSCP